MNQWNIIAKYSNLDNDYKPVSKIIKVKLTSNDKYISPSKSKKDAFFTGIVAEKGNNCVGEFEIGDRISISPTGRFFVNYKNGYIFVREEDIFWVYN